MRLLRRFMCFLLLGTVFILFFIKVFLDDDGRDGTFYLHMASSPAFPTSMMSTEHWMSGNKRYKFIWNTVLKEPPDLNFSSDQSKKLSLSNPNQMPITAFFKYPLEDQGPYKVKLSPSQSFPAHLKLRQANRRRIIREICLANSSLNFPGKFKTFDQIPKQALDHLIVDDRHGVIYCFVPKVACTNWKRIMIVLSQNLKTSDGASYRDPLTITAEFSHSPTHHLTFNKFQRRFGRASRHLMLQKLKNYTKFLFVRDPIVRLMSAFRNKFAQPNEDFYKQFGTIMLQQYANLSTPPGSAQEAFAAGIRPSFLNFVKYLLDADTEKKEPFNEHWQQVYRLCHPCQIEYDFVGKLETLDEDAEHLLKILGIDNQIKFPPGFRNRTSANWEQEWFANISLDDRRKLYKLYEPDFKLFGYDKPETLLCKPGLNTNDKTTNCSNVS
ncbi:carbohydrate sulfotransferase 12-like [Xyrauchen texanus]|uniref:carbohydrate sulfotransferase 12-like n=1 Tax=Xyrauchen texanus TaxID=154827 RepID=UPI00224238F3|nr:carbohydrate sulfotransferase 12-like [Xyrauchen texanus]